MLTCKYFLYYVSNFATFGYHVLICCTWRKTINFYKHITSHHFYAQTFIYNSVLLLPCQYFGNFIATSCYDLFISFQDFIRKVLALLIYFNNSYICMIFSELSKHYVTIKSYRITLPEHFYNVRPSLIIGGNFYPEGLC